MKTKNMAWNQPHILQMLHKSIVFSIQQLDQYLVTQGNSIEVALRIHKEPTKDNTINLIHRLIMMFDMMGDSAKILTFQVKKVDD